MVLTPLSRNLDNALCGQAVEAAFVQALLVLVHQFLPSSVLMQHL